MRGRAVAGVGSVLVALAAWSGPCDWRWVNPAPPRTDLHRIAYAYGTFVAVGDGGTILTSSDGLSWTPRPSGVTANLYGVHWGWRMWVAVGDGVVLSSSDAKIWVVRVDEPGLALRDVEYTTAKFVAVGAGLDGGVLASPDGVSWSVEGEGLPDGARAAEWTGSSLYACRGEEVFAAGSDLQWRSLGDVPAVAKAAAGGEEDRCDLAWSGDRLLWVGGVAAYSSSDGSSWEEKLTVTEGCPAFGSLGGVYSDGDLMVVSGTTACPPLLEPDALLYVSEDGGDTWQLAWNEPGEGFEAFATSLSMLVAVGRRGDLVASSDGVSWSCVGAACTSAASVDDFLAAVATGDDVAVGGGVQRWPEAKRVGGGTLARSHDGAAWEVAPLTTDTIAGLAWSGSRLAAVGASWAASSADGASWDVSSLGSSKQLRAVAWGGDRFLAVGDDGAAVESNDGETWSSVWTPYVVDLQDVVWGDGQFVAVGRQGTILSREHDILSHRSLSQNGQDLHGLTMGEGRYLAVGDRGTILASADGREWSGRVADVADDLFDVAWSGNAFVAVGAAPAEGGARAAAIVASSDGDHWTRLPAPGAELRAVAPLGGGFVAAGLERTLLYAPCVGPLLALDPQILRISGGDHQHLELSLSEPVSRGTTVTVSVSSPQVVSAPAELTLGAGTSGVEVPLEGLAPGGSWVRVTLPAEAGGGSTSAWVVVHGSTWPPRHPARRIQR